MIEPGRRPLVTFGFAVIVASVVGSLGAAILALPEQAAGLADEVDRNLDASGVANPVTAVLLNFRGYDTLLELLVMLVAVLGARALVASKAGHEVRGRRWTASPVLDGFVRVMAPVMIVVAGYLLWAGSHAPGGAFQAGAVLAALGVLLRLGKADWTHLWSGPRQRWLLAIGLIIFLAVGSATALAGHHVLQYPLGWAKGLILLIESFVMISIAAILVALFHGGSLIDASRTRESSERGHG